MSGLHHIYKGPKGQCELIDIYVVEFASNSIREEVIKKFQKRSEINNAKLANLQADRAKTQIQLKRNTALRDALSKIKGDPRNKNKKCEILWKKTDPKDKDREVVVDDFPVFRQTALDMQGRFLSSFENLTL